MKLVHFRLIFKKSNSYVGFYSCLPKQRNAKANAELGCWQWKRSKAEHLKKLVFMLMKVMLEGKWNGLLAKHRNKNQEWSLFVALAVDLISNFIFLIFFVSMSVKWHDKGLQESLVNSRCRGFRDQWMCQMKTTTISFNLRNLPYLNCLDYHATYFFI